MTALQGGLKLGDLEVSLSHDTKSINISVSGPADVWFGIGFGATAMKDQPYAVIVGGGDGAVTERKLADHGPGRSRRHPAFAFPTFYDIPQTFGNHWFH